MTNLALRPMFIASVSGGKDSLYMLGLILSMPKKYPLDCVVHFELEIDFPWVKTVIDKMENDCKIANIPFYRIKPRFTYSELFKKFSFPNRVTKWCNFIYKLDCRKQFEDFVKSLNCRPIFYIGLCADEENRFKYDIGSDWCLGDVCYPLAEEDIKENFILEWAKNNPVFQSYYKFLPRQGCMFCPNMSRLGYAYLYVFYRDSFHQVFCMIKHYEIKVEKKFFYPYDADYIQDLIIKKYVPRIYDIMNYKQLEFDFLGNVYER